MVLDRLGMRIVAGLQVDGRCSWRRMATALGEPERNVTRRGTELLESGAMVVTVVWETGPAVLVRAVCAPGTIRAATHALAARSDCVFAYALTGSADCVAELEVAGGDRTGILLDELPGVVGISRVWGDPVLRYFRTVKGWQPGLLTPTELAALEGAENTEASPPTGPMRDVDRLIVEELRRDGRAGIASLARLASVSEATVRRRLRWLLGPGNIRMRVVVEPAALGLPVEAMLWIKAKPLDVSPLAESLLESPMIRYAAAIAGEHQVIANVTLPDEDALYRIATESEWAAHAQSIDIDLVLEASKRSGRVLRRP